MTYLFGTGHPANDPPARGRHTPSSVHPAGVQTPSPPQPPLLSRRLQWPGPEPSVSIAMVTAHPEICQQKTCMARSYPDVQPQRRSHSAEQRCMSSHEQHQRPAVPGTAARCPGNTRRRAWQTADSFAILIMLCVYTFQKKKCWDRGAWIVGTLRQGRSRGVAGIVFFRGSGVQVDQGGGRCAQLGV